jgi:hypothetical protein
MRDYGIHDSRFESAALIKGAGTLECCDLSKHWIVIGLLTYDALRISEYVDSVAASALITRPLLPCTDYELAAENC